MIEAVKRLAKRVLPPAAIRFLKQRSGHSGSPTAQPAYSARGDSSASSLDDVRHLEDRLDLGYVKAASAALLDLVGDETEPEEIRAGAALGLARWDVRHDRYESALEHLEHSPTGTKLDLEIASLAADCLCRLGHGRRALAHLSVILDRGEATASTTIRVGSARSLIDGDRGYGSGWLVTEINRLYLNEGLTPIARRDVTSRRAVANLTGNPPRYLAEDALISVIVPTYNCASTIEASLLSLLGQSWPAFEVLVVDAGSFDSTMDIVERLAEENPQLRVAGRASSGCLFEAVNRGVDKALGELITIQDGRLWSHPQRLEIQAATLLHDSRAFVSGISFLAVDAKDFLHRPPGPIPDERLILRDVGSVMYRRAALDRVGLWDLADIADEEHVRRTEAVFGLNGVTWVADGVPLIMRAVEGGDETRSSAKIGLYREAFTWWHNSEPFRANLPYRPTDGTHPFAPWFAERNDANATPVAVVLGDLSGIDKVVGDLLELVDRHPGRVGIIHLPAFETRSRAMLPALQERVARGTLVDLSSQSSFTTGVLLLTTSVLESPPVEDLPSISASDLYVLVSEEADFVPPTDWTGIPVKGVLDSGSAFLSQILAPA